MIPRDYVTSTQLLWIFGGGLAAGVLWVALKLLGVPLP